ncbi:uncharacterized protein LOC144630438 [Oculina patagonica]
MESLLKNLKQHLTCSICLDIYNEPKTISCLHTFCCECLSNHARASHRQGKFRCPECQALIDLLKGNRFKSLPSSFFHNSLLSLLAVRRSGDGSNITCSQCRKTNSQMYYCFNCGRFMCPDCNNAHDMLKDSFEGHKVTAVKELSNQADLKTRVEVLIEPAKDVTNVLISEKEDDNLRLKFTPKAPGAYSIEVKINGDKLPTCPFTMQVKEREFVVVGELDLKFFQSDLPKGFHGIAANIKDKMVVIDNNGHCVYVFDNEGNCLRKNGNQGSNSGQFKSPSGVTFLNDNEILIADQENHRIQHLNIQTGTVVKSFGKRGAGTGEFKNPVDVCLDDEGRIVVTELNNHRIHVLSKEGETISIFGDSGPEKLNCPTSCIPYKNMFLVSDTFNKCIKIYDQSGTFMYKFGTQGNQDGQFNLPYGILVDRSNNLLVCDNKNHRVQQFSLDGRFTGKTFTHLPDPVGIATAPDGRILVTSFTAKKVYILK